MRTPASRKPVKNVDEYLSNLPEDVRLTLEKIRKAIRTAAPGAEEVISFHIPVYKQSGKLVGFAGYENHCSFYAMNPMSLLPFAEALQPFEKAGMTIHFPPKTLFQLHSFKKSSECE